MEASPGTLQRLGTFELMTARFDRDRHLKSAVNRTDPWDLIIIGGGASGVGCALDAVTRGLSVLLLEGTDFGKGTSSRSTKLIHGGVRYLRQGNFSLVRESLRERTRLLRNAPHLVHPIEFILPCRSLMEIGYYSLGMNVYDWLASSPEFHRSKRLSKEQVLSKQINLSPNNLSGGISYFDGQFDDSRLLINLVQTAAEKGAILVNAARVIDLTKNRSGKIEGVVFCEEETGKTHMARGRCVLNATGPFCDFVRRLDQPDTTPLVAASQGIHLVLGKEFFPGESALIVPKTRDGRVMFIIPWHEHVLLGTTDTAIPEAREEPQALDEEIAFLLETAGEYLRKCPARDDCLSVFAGIRPLVKAQRGVSTSSLSRDHTMEVSATGLLTLTGGKWTTYRQMAEDCVDRVLKLLGRPYTPSKTHDLRLHGYPQGTQQSGSMANAVYGSDAVLLEQLVNDEPSLGQRLHPDLPIRGAEVVWAIRHEWARTIEDVLARRTRALFLNAHAAMEMAPMVVRLLASELDRDDTWQAAQLASFQQTASIYMLNG